MKNNIRSFDGHTPVICDTAFIDPSAIIIGEVSIAAHASVWPGVVIRGDINDICIGYMSNIQDLSMLHVAHKSPQNPRGYPLHIGEYVTIGHQVTLHGCTICDESLIGMGAIVLDGAVVEKHVLVGAGSVVPPGARLESGYLYIGSPAKKIRPLSVEEICFFKQSALNYLKYGEAHRRNLSEN